MQQVNSLCLEMEVQRRSLHSGVIIKDRQRKTRQILDCLRTVFISCLTFERRCIMTNKKEK